jgi:hypothetical protein
MGDPTFARVHLRERRVIMVASRFRRFRAFVAVGALLFLAVGTLATPASAATKLFALNITDSTAGSGTTHSYSATITNESGGTLDSVTIAPPTGSGFTILSPSGGTFGSLDLDKGASTTRSFTAITPCVAPPKSFDWTATGKGLNNQAYVLDTVTSSRTTTVILTCSLAMSHVGSAEKNTRISVSDYTSTGDSVTATLLDSDGHPITSASGTTVELTLETPSDPQPDQSWLQGGSANLNSDGIASFSSLSATQPNLNYTVAASVPSNTAITDGTSNTFQIWDKDIKCNAGSPCGPGQSYKAGDLITEPLATFATDGGILVSYDVQNALCQADTYNHLPNVVTVDTEGHQAPTGDFWTLTFTVSKHFDQLQPQNGASFYHVCLATKLPFKTLGGDDAVKSGDFYYGLVQTSPRCDDPAPCQMSATKTKTGTVIIVLRLEPGDPWTH